LKAYNSHAKNILCFAYDNCKIFFTLIYLFLNGKQEAGFIS